MLDQDVKARWIAALRSGEFAQCKFELRHTDAEGIKSHCCLGVLAEIEGIGLEENEELEIPIDNCASLLDLLKSLKMPERKYMNDLDEGKLVKMNDQDGKSFEEIADWIEANL